MNEKHCRSINDAGEKHCRDINIMNGKSSRNRNIAEGKSCNRIKTTMKSCKDFAKKLEANYYKDFRKLEKVRRQAGRSLCKYVKKSCALRKYNFRAMCRKSLCRCA